MRIALVAGARPNFMKVALSDVFFTELQLPKPDVWLGVGSGTHAEQTARVMTGFETVCLERTPDASWSSAT